MVGHSIASTPAANAAAAAAAGGIFMHSISAEQTGAKFDASALGSMMAEKLTNAGLTLDESLMFPMIMLARSGKKRRHMSATETNRFRTRSSIMSRHANRQKHARLLSSFVPPGQQSSIFASRDQQLVERFRAGAPAGEIRGAVVDLM